MQSPGTPTSYYVCPRDQSVHYLNVPACSHCGWPFTHADVNPPSALKICPTCNVYVGMSATMCMNCRCAIAAGPPYGQRSYVGAYPRQNFGASAMLPLDVKSRFNWGAAMFTWIWGLNHKKPETLLALVVGLIPFGGLVAAIYIGIKGNEWAWDSGRFQSVDEMIECQRIWTKWAIWVFALSVAAPCLLLLFLPLVASMGGQRIR